MHVVMIGTGYVGLVTGTCFADWGFQVTCVDKDTQKIQHIEQGIMPIHEPGLEKLVQRNRDAGRLHFTTDLASAVHTADVVMIAVGTPTHEDGHQADLRYVYAAATEIGQHITAGTVVVTKSTVPVGTTPEVERRVRETAGETEFYVASNPEFLREGSAIADFMNPDRVVIGTQTEEARSIMARLYEPLSRRLIPILYTDTASSELSKYAANAFLATKIAFINEMADLAEKYGANVEDIAIAMGQDRRIGRDFLKPGPGFGGSCFPKDTRALLAMAQDVGAGDRITDAVIASNAARKYQVVERLRRLLEFDLKGRTVAVLGLTFKANTDDMRESASLVVIEQLIKEGCTVKAYDPQGMQAAKPMLPQAVQYCDNSYDAATGADVALVLTEWEEFAHLNLHRLKQVMKHPAMLDMRNLYRPEMVEDAGFIYVSVGRKPVPEGVRI